MTTFRPRRVAFTPETLSTFDHTIDEVWEELLADDILAHSGSDEDQLRARLAQKLINFASSGRSDAQIKQLLLRKFRNEVSAARYEHSQIESLLSEPCEDAGGRAPEPRPLTKNGARLAGG
jgi:hypothetical protein